MNVQENHRYFYNSALVSNCEDFYSANYPTLSSFKNSKMIIISTPNGMYNKFWELYEYSTSWKEIKENKVEDSRKEKKCFCISEIWLKFCPYSRRKLRKNYAFEYDRTKI